MERFSRKRKRGDTLEDTLHRVRGKAPTHVTEPVPSEPHRKTRHTPTPVKDDFQPVKKAKKTTVEKALKTLGGDTEFKKHKPKAQAQPRPRPDKVVHSKPGPIKARSKPVTRPAAAAPKAIVAGPTTKDDKDYSKWFSSSKASPAAAAATSAAKAGAAIKPKPKPVAGPPHTFNKPPAPKPMAAKPRTFNGRAPKPRVAPRTRRAL